MKALLGIGTAAGVVAVITGYIALVAATEAVHFFSMARQKYKEG